MVAVPLRTAGKAVRPRGSRFPIRSHLLVAATLSLSSVALAADDAAVRYEAIRAADLRLATIGHRLVRANLPLCDSTVLATGLVIHAIDQYPSDERPAVRNSFGFAAPVAVEAVVPGSAAARAGMRPNDAIAAVDGAVLGPAVAGGPTTATRDRFYAYLAEHPPQQPLRLTVRRASGGEAAVSLSPERGCATRFELVFRDSLTAEADGTVVQVSSRFLETMPDDMVAVVVAHELAHNVLRHRERLEAAGVSFGLMREFGRNRRLFRRTEDEADALGMHLLRNAGYDPQIAVRFWQEHGTAIDKGLFRARTHASWKARAAAIRAAIAALPAGAPIPYIPPLLETRGEPLR